MKKVRLSLIILAGLSLVISGCAIRREIETFSTSESETEQGEEEVEKEIELDPISPAKFKDYHENKALFSDNYYLSFLENDDGISVQIINGETDLVTYISENPIHMNVREKHYGVMDTDFNIAVIAAKYQSIEHKEYGYLLKATITTDLGSVFDVQDAYSSKDCGGFSVTRRIKVISQDETKKETGFSSSVEFINAFGSGKYDDFTYFMPSTFYKDDELLSSSAIAQNLNIEGKLLVKETRTGLPLSMIKNVENGESLALSHFNIEVNVNGLIGGGTVNEVNDNIIYGSIGFTITPNVGVDFHFPGSEGPASGDTDGWSRRYHSVKEGNIDMYSVAIIPGNSDTHNDETVECFKKGFLYENPQVEKIDMDEIYQQNLTLFRDYYKEFGTSYGGEPWSIQLPDGQLKQGYSSEMGFVGQQTAVGYHYLRNGFRNNVPGDVLKGKKIIDFWTSNTIMNNKFPIVWWDPGEGANSGSPRTYPCFLRCMIDGLEGILDAYRIATAFDASGNYTQWREAILKFANNLVNVQNDDGSFYRAYNLNATVFTGNDPAAAKGESKLNTPVAIRFLAKMYEFTGDEKYKTAAINAAEYSYTNIYEALGKYVGGTADNPNYVDKEAAVFAMYGFTSAYNLTHEEKYLKAAKHATVCSISWMYCFDFAVPSNFDLRKINVFQNGGAIGFSFILNGNKSSADNYASYISYAVYKLYVLTGDEFYKKAAILVQNATKMSSDYDGRMGFKYRALCPEATRIADFSFGSVGTWLPWCGVAAIEPLANLYETFHEINIEDIDSDLSSLKYQLAIYGDGGKPIEL